MPDPLFFDSAETSSYYALPLDTARKAGLTAVISNERLSGHPSSGGRDRCMIADRLRVTFPEARILIVIREQRALIQSMYNQHIAAGGVESIERWLSAPAPGNGRKPGFAFEFYEFDRLIRYYHDLFGPDHVLVLPLEQLAVDSQQFADRICSFCGHKPMPVPPDIRRNVRRPHTMQLAQRPMNMLFFHNDLSPGALIHISLFNHRWAKLRPIFETLSLAFVDRWLNRRQMRLVEEIVGTRYAQSNRRTQEITGLPLAENGYPVE